MIEDDDLDVEEFLSTIQGNKPPFQCPFNNCVKIFRSFPAIQKHLNNIHNQVQQLEICELDLINDENKNPSSNESHFKRTSKIVTESVQLSYADSKKFVTLQNDRKSFRCNVNLPMNVDYVDEAKLDKFNDTINKSLLSESFFSTDISFNQSIVEENSNDTPSESFCNKKKRGKKRKGFVNTRYVRKIRKIDQSLNDKSDILNKEEHEATQKVVIPVPIYNEDEKFTENKKHIPNITEGYIHFLEKSADELNEIVEYDLDEEDLIWLPMCNNYLNSISSSSKKSLRNSSTPIKSNKRIPNIVSKDIMEYVMDRFEKECHFESNHHKIDEDAVCDICLDGSCENTNAILFCDVCNLAVHQECYGVPFVPEGQWLCRKCLHSPSKPVECSLCPNKGGAFKQTNDGKWSHVVCALWIPEVRFANLIFLEPIEDIEKIEPARWRLTCYLCKQKNVGACIQCHKSNCYTAFHVTCAQHAGLYMIIEQKDRVNGGLGGVKKSTYCDIHSPSDYTPGICRSMYAHHEDDNNVDKLENRQRHLKDVRKLLSQRQSFTPPPSYPIITPDKLKTISETLDLPYKDYFMERIHSYWTLKREIRRGVPLLRRLVASSKSNLSTLPLEDDNPEIKTSLKFWQQLRQDLEKARLLSELSRKREKLKRELFKNFISINRNLMNPTQSILTKLLNSLQALDRHRIFAKPVTDTIAPNYSKIIKNPMDFCTMFKKLTENFDYVNVDQIRNDFDLMIANCQKYNGRNTFFYKKSLKINSQSQSIFEKFYKHYESIGLDKKTGLFLNKSIYEMVLNGHYDDPGFVYNLEKIMFEVNPTPDSADSSTYETASSTSHIEINNNQNYYETNDSVIIENKDNLNVSRKMPATSTTNDSNISSSFINKTKKKSKKICSNDYDETNSNFSNNDFNKITKRSNYNRVSSSIYELPDSSTTTNNSKLLSKINRKSKSNSLNNSHDKLDSTCHSVSNNDYDINNSWVNSTQNEIKNLNDCSAVWIRPSNGFWFPGVILDPSNRNIFKEMKVNLADVPEPPVLNEIENNESDYHLIMMFDKRRQMLWLRSKNIDVLGSNKEKDNRLLKQMGKSNRNLAIQSAYRCAVRLLCERSGIPYPPDYEISRSNEPAKAFSL